MRDVLLLSVLAACNAGQATTLDAAGDGAPALDLAVRVSDTTTPAIDKDASTSTDDGMVPIGIKPAGVALSFDDDFVDQWYEARSLLKRYGAKVTFFVTRFDKLSGDQISKLQQLQRDGHEIGCHGLTHVSPSEYAQAHSPQAYIDDEIVPALELMAKYGFSPTTFAYPWGGRTDELDELLLGRFRMLRGSGRVARAEQIATTPGSTRLVFGASIDSSRATLDEIQAALEYTKNQSKVLTLYTHRITDEPTDRSHITPAALEAVLARARTLGLRFYRFADLAPTGEREQAGLEVMYDWLDTGDIRTADGMLANTWTLPRYDSVKLDWPLSWREDPYGENYWRFIFYSLRPLRHLLYAYRQTGDARYLEQLRAVLVSFANNGQSSPYILEKHGIAFRAMVLTNIYGKLARLKKLDQELEQTLRELIEATSRLLEDANNFEKTYNHGVTQAAALLLVSANFPNLAGAARWRTLASQRLDELLGLVVDKDGVEVEQSPYYHFYVFRFFWYVHAWTERHHVVLGSDAMRTVIAKMLRFATYITQPDGQIPLLGSSLPLNIRSEYKDVLPAAAETRSDFAYVWSGGKQGTPPEPVNILFPTAGVAILRSSFGDSHDGQQQTQVIFDVGPYRTDHSHLDALQVHLYAAGRPLLVDSGLFTYEAGTHHDYYRGTRAHNTVIVDGQDQREGNATAVTFLDKRTWAYQSAFHDLYQGIRHRRGVLLLQRDLVLVIDRLESTGDATRHRFEQTWHLFNSADVAAEADTTTVKDANGVVVLRALQALTPGVSADVFVGSTRPRQGWYSDAYEVEVPAPALVYRMDGTSAAFVTLFATGPLARQSLSLNASRDKESWLINITSAETRTEVRINKLALAGESVVITR